jgi:hypothetical protein
MFSKDIYSLEVRADGCPGGVEGQDLPEYQIGWDQVESGDLGDQFGHLDDAIRVRDVEKGQYDHQLHGINHTPEHLQAGGHQKVGNEVAHQ